MILKYDFKILKYDFIPKDYIQYKTKQIKHKQIVINNI